MEENKKNQKEETSKTMSSDVDKVKGQQPAPPKQPTNKQTGNQTSQAREEEEAEKGHA